LQEWRLPLVIAAVAGLVWLGGMTMRQVRVWKNSGTLFEHMLSNLGASLYRADVVYRLGAWKQARGETAAALEHYREALELYPNFADAHARAGAALIEQGRIEEAVNHYLAALKSNPDHISALNNLAWLRATQPDAKYRDGAEAVRLGEQACELTAYKQPMLMGTLAAAYAEAGRFEDAVAMAKKATTLAREQGNNELVKTNERLLEVYKRGERYREHRK
jgi:tetratricopeptide (TPR) repeat protein